MRNNFADAKVRQQIKFYEHLKVKFVASPMGHVIGVCEPFDAESDLMQGLRRQTTDEETGWYIWTGDGGADDIGFFKHVSVRDFGLLCPSLVPYLGLAPGWRFTVESGSLKVWFDAALI